MQPELSQTALVFARPVHGTLMAGRTIGPAFLLHSGEIVFSDRQSGFGLHQGSLGLYRDATGGIMIRPRSADDFLAIRARMEELRRERVRLPDEKDPLSVRASDDGSGPEMPSRLMVDPRGVSAE